MRTPPRISAQKPKIPPHTRSSLLFSIVIGSVAGISAVLLVDFVLFDDPLVIKMGKFAGENFGLPAPFNGCIIKGNISINTRQKIYHVPGQKFYFQTKISPEYGERWFCSEDEARRHGWRKARR